MEAGPQADGLCGGFCYWSLDSPRRRLRKGLYHQPKCASDMPLTALGQWRCGTVAVFMYELMHGPKRPAHPLFGLVAYSTGVYPAVFLVVFSTNHILINVVPVIYHQVDSWWSS